MPSVLAVFRLITSLNLTGGLNGRSSLGFSPLRMRSAYDAARRNSSTTSGPYEINAAEFCEVTRPIDGGDKVAISQHRNVRTMANREGIRHPR